MNTNRTVIGAVGLAGLLLLTGCGGSDADDAGGSATDGASAPAGERVMMDGAQIEEIRACLEAAGLEDELPTDMPTDRPSDLPTDMPTDMPTAIPTDRPTDLPTDLPSGVPSGAPGGGFGVFQDPEVQDALEACGIDLPRVE